jgi:hypothetical protein
MLNVIILKDNMLIVFKLNSVMIKVFILKVIMLNVFILKVMEPSKINLYFSLETGISQIVPAP